MRNPIPQSLNVACRIFPFHLDPSAAYHAERGQFHSSEIFEQIEGLVRPGDWRLLALADVDSYIPILKYVFGEARMGGPWAAVATFRARQKFYGLERDDALLKRRLLKECVRELGHALDLGHCRDHRCVMASLRALEWIDLRQSCLYLDCRWRLESSRHMGEAVGTEAHHKLPSA